jgi:hypothetical protein
MVYYAAKVANGRRLIHYAQSFATFQWHLLHSGQNTTERGGTPQELYALDLIFSLQFSWK